MGRESLLPAASREVEESPYQELSRSRSGDASQPEPQDLAIGHAQAADAEIFPSVFPRAASPLASNRQRVDLGRSSEDALHQLLRESAPPNAAQVSLAQPANQTGPGSEVRTDRAPGGGSGGGSGGGAPGTLRKGVDRADGKRTSSDLLVAELESLVKGEASQGKSWNRPNSMTFGRQPSLSMGHFGSLYSKSGPYGPRPLSSTKYGENSLQSPASGPGPRQPELLDVERAHLKAERLNNQAVDRRSPAEDLSSHNPDLLGLLGQPTDPIKPGFARGGSSAAMNAGKNASQSAHQLHPQLPRGPHGVQTDGSVARSLGMPQAEGTLKTSRQASQPATRPATAAKGVAMGNVPAMASGPRPPPNVMRRPAPGSTAARGPSPFNSGAMGGRPPMMNARIDAKNLQRPPNSIPSAPGGPAKMKAQNAASVPKGKAAIQPPVKGRVAETAPRGPPGSGNSQRGSGATPRGAAPVSSVKTKPRPATAVGTKPQGPPPCGVQTHGPSPPTKREAVHAIPPRTVDPEKKRRLDAAPSANQMRALNPDVTTPFESDADVWKRLVAYHVFYTPDLEEYVRSDWDSKIAGLNRKYEDLLAERRESTSSTLRACWTSNSSHVDAKGTTTATAAAATTGMTPPSGKRTASAEDTTPCRTPTDTGVAGSYPKLGVVDEVIVRRIMKRFAAAHAQKQKEQELQQQQLQQQQQQHQHQQPQQHQSGESVLETRADGSWPPPGSPMKKPALPSPPSAPPAPEMPMAQPTQNLL